MNNDYKRKVLETAQRIVNDKEFLYQAIKDFDYKDTVSGHFLDQLLEARAQLNFLKRELERD